MFGSAVRHQSRFQNLFLQEEFYGDQLINYIRFFLLFVLLALAFIKANVFSGLVVSQSFVLTLILLGGAYVYTIAFMLLYRARIYKPAFKYFSVTLDMSLVVLAIYSYKLDPYPEYAQIFLVARYSLIFWFILWSLVRYNVWLSLFSGVLGAVEYFALVMLNNEMSGLEFSFVAPDGVMYTSSFTSTETLLRVLYILLAGVMASIVAQRLRRLVINSITQEEEKNKLFTENKIVEAVNLENRKYLDGITQGLLLIDSNYIIGEQYSQFLSHLFPRDDIAGSNLVDFLFPDVLTQETDRRELERYLNILFTSLTVDEDTLGEANPVTERIFRIFDRNGNVTERTLSVSFNRLYEEGAIANVMVIFKDLTAVAAAQRDLEEERERHAGDLETVSVILKTGHRTLSDFIEDARSALMEAQDSIASLQDRDVLNRSFRKLHGLKGSAASLGFAEIAKLAHAAEEVLAQVRDDELPVTDDIEKELETRIHEIFAGFDAIQRLTKSFLEFSQMEMTAEVEDSGAQLNDLLESFPSMVADLAEELDKNAIFAANNELNDAPFLPQLKNSIIHLVRNAVDHGLEDVYERLSKGKQDSGTISFKAFMKDSVYVIEVLDDGRGLDFDAIRKKAVERGLLPESSDTASVPESKLLNALFSPGFSTRDTATTISGRGVGLDIVRDAVRELQGKISVSTHKDKGTRVVINIPAQT